LINDVTLHRDWLILGCGFGEQAASVDSVLFKQYCMNIHVYGSRAILSTSTFQVEVISLYAQWSALPSALHLALPLAVRPHYESSFSMQICCPLSGCSV